MPSFMKGEQDGSIIRIECEDGTGFFGYSI